MKENEQQFDDLQRLLKLKRHEVPPPGYFNRFSGDVISRIRADERHASGELASRLEASAPWLVKLLRIFEAKPGIVGGFATSLCVLLLLGVVFAEYSDTASKPSLAITPTPTAENS